MKIRDPLTPTPDPFNWYENTTSALLNARMMHHTLLYLTASTFTTMAMAGAGALAMGWDQTMHQSVEVCSSGLQEVSGWGHATALYRPPIHTQGHIQHHQAGKAAT